MKLRRIALSLVLCTMVLAGSFGVAAAAGKNAAPASKQSTSGAQGYAADGFLQIGTIVQLSKGDNHKVEAANKKTVQQMYGVVVDPHQQAVTISDSSLKNETFVATAGTYKVLVSTENGVINVGDYVTISSVDGVGMNANIDGTTVFGRAAGNFDGKHDVMLKTTLKDSTGKPTKEIAVGTIPVAINVQRNPAEKSTTANLPQALQRIGKAIADKPVSPAKMYIGILITGLVVIGAMVVIYSGVRSGIISLGRNPLSRGAVYRGIFGSVLTSALILIIGLFAVYLLLKM